MRVRLDACEAALPALAEVTAGSSLAKKKCLVMEKGLASARGKDSREGACPWASWVLAVFWVVGVLAL